MVVLRARADADDSVEKQVLELCRQSVSLQVSLKKSYDAYHNQHTVLIADIEIAFLQVCHIIQSLNSTFTLVF